MSISNTAISIPIVIEKLGIGQGGSSNFLTGTRDIAKGKDRSEGKKFDGKPTPHQNQFFNHERYTVPQMMGTVIDQKRLNLQEKIDHRFKGANLLKETVYVSSDLGTAGFSMVQGVSLLSTPSSALTLVGSVSGLVGGILNIGQGLFLLTEALQSFKNGQKEQGARVLADALLLIGIGLFMTLASLALLGVKLGCLAGAAAVAANPYAMPILLLLLVLPGLIQTLKHIGSEMRGADLASQLKLNTMDREKILQSPLVQKLAALNPSLESLEEISQTMETISEQVGVEAGIDVVELLKLLLEKSQDELIEEKMKTANQKVAAWSRMVRLRAVQLSLYGLTFPLGLISALVSASVAKIIGAASKFFLSAPSSLGAYMDSFEPFKRNGAIAVPNVDVSLLATA